MYSHFIYSLSFQLHAQYFIFFKVRPFPRHFFIKHYTIVILCSTYNLVISIQFIFQVRPFPIQFIFQVGPFRIQFIFKVEPFRIQFIFKVEPFRILFIFKVGPFSILFVYKVRPFPIQFVITTPCNMLYSSKSGPFQYSLSFLLSAICYILQIRALSYTVYLPSRALSYTVYLQSQALSDTVYLQSQALSYTVYLQSRAFPIQFIIAYQCNMLYSSKSDPFPIPFVFATPCTLCYILKSQALSYTVCHCYSMCNMLYSSTLVD